jgi:hypothetical protein
VRWYSALQRCRVPGNGVTREADRGSNRAICPEPGSRRGRLRLSCQAMTVQHPMVSPARPDLPVVIPPPHAGTMEKTVSRRVGHKTSAVNPGTRGAGGNVRCPNSAATFGHRSAKTLFGVRIRLPLSGTEAQSRRSLSVLVPFLSGATIAEGCAAGFANDIFVRKRRGVGADKNRKQYHSGMLAPQRLPPQ